MVSWINKFYLGMKRLWNGYQDISTNFRKGSGLIVAALLIINPYLKPLPALTADFRSKLVADLKNV